MSFIVAFITDDSIVMAADKREIYVDGSGHNDNCEKIHRRGNCLYGLTGSGELIKIFEQHDTSDNANSFIEYANMMFDHLDQTRKYKATYENWIKQRFDLSLLTAGIIDKKPFISIHQVLWNEKGFSHGSVESTRRIPCFLMPAKGADYVEEYILKNHPDTGENAVNVVDVLMRKVSSLNTEVSPQYDIEVLKL